MQYNKFCCETVTQLQNSNVGVAQLDRAFGYGPKGRGFESSRPRLKALQREVLFYIIGNCISYYIKSLWQDAHCGVQ